MNGRAGALCLELPRQGDGSHGEWRAALDHGGRVEGEAARDAEVLAQLLAVSGDAELRALRPGEQRRVQRARAVSRTSASKGRVREAKRLVISSGRPRKEAFTARDRAGAGKWEPLFLPRVLLRHRSRKREGDVSGGTTGRQGYGFQDLLLLLGVLDALIVRRSAQIAGGSAPDPVFHIEAPPDDRSPDWDLLSEESGRRVLEEVKGGGISRSERLALWRRTRRTVARSWTVA